MRSPALLSDRRRLAALRLAAQRIGSSELTTPGDTVRWMLAMQGQEFAGVRWSVGLRHGGATEADVAAALDAGEIVRSWPLRGTLHLVAAEDLGWMLALTAPRLMVSAARRRAWLGITDADVEGARAAAIAALTGRRVLTRDALLATIDSAGVGTAGQRAYHLLWTLAQTGTLVLGPTEGTQQTFALLDEWVPKPRRLERDEALSELALRYIRSHGPATDKDLARWSGLTLGDVRRGLAVCVGRLTTLELGGSTYHVAPETLADAAPQARVSLLPGFDEYLLGYRDRTAVLAPEHSDAIVPGGNGVFKPTIVVDGEVVGTWRRRVTAGEIVIEPAPFGRLSGRDRKGLEEAARAYGAFIGLPARLAAPETRAAV
jgi:hypothetical protein